MDSVLAHLTAQDVPTVFVIAVVVGLGAAITWLLAVLRAPDRRR